MFCERLGEYTAFNHVCLRVAEALWSSGGARPREVRVLVWERKRLAKKKRAKKVSWSWVAIPLSRCIHKARWADEWSHMVIPPSCFPTQTHPHPLPCAQPLLFFSATLLQVFGETATWYCSSIKLLTNFSPFKRKNLGHHALLPRLATSAPAFTFRLIRAVVFFLFCILESLAEYFDTLPSRETVANWERSRPGNKNFFV